MKEDLISRQAAIDALSCENPTEIYVFYDDAVKAIKGLPSAELKPCDFCIYDEDCEDMRIYCPARGREE